MLSNILVKWLKTLIYYVAVIQLYLVSVVLMQRLIWMSHSDIHSNAHSNSDTSKLNTRTQPLSHRHSRSHSETVSADRVFDHASEEHVSDGCLMDCKVLHLWTGKHVCKRPNIDRPSVQTNSVKSVTMYIRTRNTVDAALQ